MGLDTVNWRIFSLTGDGGIFELHSSNSEIDEKKLEDNGNFTIPYVTRTNNENGVKKFVSEKQNKRYKINPGNVISIGLDTQTAFYQPYPFFTGQNIQILTHPSLNRFNALFIVEMLRIQLKKFNWGGNGATLGRLSRTKIILPSDNDGNPDFQFMEKYISKIWNEILDKYKHYISRELSEMSVKNTGNIEWSSFYLSDIFDIKHGKRLESYNQIDGKRPFISSTKFLNGISNFVSNINESLDSNVLGVNYNGSVAESFYHPYECIFSDDVKRFKLKEREGNKYIYLFIKNSILCQQSKYKYGYKFKKDRMYRQQILLPIDSDGKPDYNFMEEYMKNIEIKMIKRYLDYLESKPL